MKKQGKAVKHTGRPSPQSPSAAPPPAPPPARPPSCVEIKRGGCNKNKIKIKINNKNKNNNTNTNTNTNTNDNNNNNNNHNNHDNHDNHANHANNNNHDDNENNDNNDNNHDNDNNNTRLDPLDATVPRTNAVGWIGQMLSKMVDPPGPTAVHLTEPEHLHPSSAATRSPSFAPSPRSLPSSSGCGNNNGLSLRPGTLWCP